MLEIIKLFKLILARPAGKQPTPSKGIKKKPEPQPKDEDELSREKFMEALMKVSESERSLTEKLL